MFGIEKILEQYKDKIAAAEKNLEDTKKKLESMDEKLDEIIRSVSSR